jgi:hypothetical protein
MKEKRNRKLTVRLTAHEYSKLFAAASSTTHLQLSSYARQLLLHKPVVMLCRNASLDAGIEEIILLRHELHALGNNLNQAVKQLHSLRQIPEFRAWLTSYDNSKQLLDDCLRGAQSRIDQITEQWLQG